MIVDAALSPCRPSVVSYPAAAATICSVYHLTFMPQSSLLSENARPCSPGSPPSPVPSLRLHRGNRKALHPLADESEDGYSSHPSIYSASPVGSESDRGCQDSSADSVALPKTEGIFEQDVEEDGGARLAERRNFSSFSGLSMLDTISEQKSAGSRSVLHDDEDDDEDDGDESDDEDDDGDTCTVDSEDDEYGYGRSYYYEYASPTQPLHPARSQSVPPRGAISRYSFERAGMGCNLNAFGIGGTGAVW